MNAYIKNEFKKEAEALATEQLKLWLANEGHSRANKAFFVATEWGHEVKEDGSLCGVAYGYGHRFFFEKKSLDTPMRVTRWLKVDNNPYFEEEEEFLPNEWKEMEIR